MKNFHLCNLAQVNDPKKNPTWMRMRLNECLRYGGSGSGKKIHRYIVYHPPVADGLKPPGMFQVSHAVGSA
jgi:hypothetical protein